MKVNSLDTETFVVVERSQLDLPATLQNLKAKVKETAQKLFKYIIKTGALGLNAELNTYHSLAYGRGEEAPKKVAEELFLTTILREIQCLEKTIKKLEEDHFQDTRPLYQKVSDFVVRLFVSSEDEIYSSWKQLYEQSKKLREFYNDVYAIENPLF